MRAWFVAFAIASCSKATPPAPAPAPAPAPKPPPTPCSVSVFVDASSAWIGTTAGTCRVALTELGDELGSLKQAFPRKCSPPLELASDAGVYQDLISAMDVAVRAGFIDVGLTPRDGLSIALPSKDPAPHCTAPQNATDPPPLPPAEPSPPPKIGSDGTIELTFPGPEDGAKDALQVAPVLVVTKTEMLFQNEPITIDQLAPHLAIEAKKTLTTLGPRQQKACADAKRGLRPAPGNICPIGLMILQADAATPMAEINRIVVTTKQAGYDNLLFAVKNR